MNIFWNQNDVNFHIFWLHCLCDNMQMEPLGTSAPAPAVQQQNERQQASLPIEFPELSLEPEDLETEW